MAAAKKEVNSKVGSTAGSRKLVGKGKGGEGCVFLVRKGGRPFRNRRRQEKIARQEKGRGNKRGKNWNSKSRRGVEFL